MSALVELTQFGARTNSRIVAEAFDKGHKGVLRAIDMILDEKPELRGRNFALTEETAVIGAAPRTLRFYEMDRDGFTLVAMGFTGAKALDWKLAFIDAFNRMEAELRADRAEDGDPSPIPVPNMGTAEDRDNFRTAVAVIRMIQQISGAEDARTYARALGFRLEHGEQGGRGTLVPAAAVPTDGDFYAWGNAAGLKRSKLEATHLRDLYEHYSRWCTARRLNAIDPDRFRRTLEMVTEPEEHPEMYRCVLSAVRGY